MRDNDLENLKAALLEIIQGSESAKDRLRAAELLLELKKAQEDFNWFDPQMPGFNRARSRRSEDKPKHIRYRNLEIPQKIRRTTHK